MSSSTIITKVENDSFRQIMTVQVMNDYDECSNDYLLLLISRWHKNNGDVPNQLL